MTPSALLIFGLMTAGLLAALPAFRGMWKGGDALARVERLWRRVWPYSETALQGWLRAQIVVYLGGCFMLLAYPAAALLGTADSSSRPTLSLVLWTGFTGFVAMVAMVISIVLFNAPKALVLPQLRGQEGLLIRRRRMRRNQNKKGRA